MNRNVIVRTKTRGLVMSSLEDVEQPDYFFSAQQRFSCIVSIFCKKLSNEGVEYFRTRMLMDPQFSQPPKL